MTEILAVVFMWACVVYCWTVFGWKVEIAVMLFIIFITCLAFVTEDSK